MVLSLPTYCCTSWVRNRFPLCEGELDFMCQVPNLICYQLLTGQAPYEKLINTRPFYQSTWGLSYQSLIDNQSSLSINLSIRIVNIGWTSVHSVCCPEGPGMEYRVLRLSTLLNTMTTDIVVVIRPIIRNTTDCCIFTSSNMKMSRGGKGKKKTRKGEKEENEMSQEEERRNTLPHRSSVIWSYE